MTTIPELCGRTACRVPLKDEKVFFNRSTRGYYCERCAIMLNRANREDAMRLYGGPLCVPVDELQAVAGAQKTDPGLSVE